MIWRHAGIVGPDRSNRASLTKSSIGFFTATQANTAGTWAGRLPVRDDSGKVVRWIGTSTDIDDLKRAEEALRAERVSPHARTRHRPDGNLGLGGPDGTT